MKSPTAMFATSGLMFKKSVIQKVLLTGRDGMLGSALAAELAIDFEVAGFARSELNILDFAAVAEKIEEVKPDFLVNAAAYTAVDQAETEKDLAEKVNSAAVGNLAQLAKKFGAKLIHFSTDYVFDGENAAGFAENAKPNPINFYGKSKLAGERKILASGCDFAIVRTSWLFGTGKKFNPQNSSGDFVDTMLRLGREKSEVKVVNDQIGSPTFAADLAAATAELLRTNARGIFHRTNSGTTSWFDFAQKIFELAEIKTKLIPITSQDFPTAARRPRSSILLNTKLPPLRSWEAALTDYLQNQS